MVKKTGQKGIVAEEVLKDYFKSAGYFVVRSIPLVYKRYDVTDVDLWLYVKASSIAAERTCVDIKRRKTPQAMERVLWTKGLKEVLGVDRAIVVTSDNRPETRDFGAAHGVGILQGDFLQHLITTSFPGGHLTEEELFSLLKSPCIVDSSVNWRVWFRRVKAKLLDGLNFDTCNSFILASKLLLDEYVATGRSSEIPVRLLYSVISYLLVCLDYTSHSFVSLEVAGRIPILTDGFRYGEAGSQRTKEIVQMALQLLTDAGKSGLFSGETLYDEFDRQVSDYRAEILSEHFAKEEVLQNLFAVACAFDDLAYAKTLLFPHELPNEQKSLLGLLCDLLQHDRKGII